jgi:cobalamin biosynthesis protein CobD/CbiB
MGCGRREADAADIRQALRLYRWACAIQALALAAAVVILFVGSAAIGRGQ